MNKLKFLLALFSSVAMGTTFNPTQGVQSSSINALFDQINSNLIIRDSALEFESFAPGDLIESSRINANLQKIKNKYPQAQIIFLEDLQIKSSSFNTVFTRVLEESLALSYRDCSDILQRGLSPQSGSYIVFDSDYNRIQVECDMSTAGGGWTKVWHGYPSEAFALISTNDKTNISNKIKFNQMRIQNVNINRNEYDFVDFGLASMNKTLPEYYNDLTKISNSAKPRVLFHDENNLMNKELASNRFLFGYGNEWRVFSSCIDVATPSYIYLGPIDHLQCDVGQYFNRNSIPDCSSQDNYYCNNAITSTYKDSKSNLTLKELQESAVWVRRTPVLASCKDYLNAGLSTGDGFYIINPNGTEIKTYCDMTTDGGGWTLVWSNLRGGTNKPVTDITDALSKSTLPRCSAHGTSANDRTGNCSIAKNTSGRFLNYFLGLSHWNGIGKNAQMEIRYEWSAIDGNINQSMKANLSPFIAPNFTLSMSSYSVLKGGVTAGLWITHNNQKWTAYNADRDIHNVNCGAIYSNTPFWYERCWSGSINGGGERSEGYSNGAYWIGSQTGFATSGTAGTGNGGGNGWMWIRHK